MAKQKIKNPGKTVAAGPDGATGKGRPLKRAHKTKVKAKSSRKNAPAGSGDAPPATASRPKSLIHKIVRRQARLGRLERLEIAVDEVRRGGRISLRTRKLQMSGVSKMAQKLIEEAGEVAIEGVQGNRAALINESVDLLYNLVVLLAECGVPIEAIWAEMDRREVTLGMAEKLPKVFDPDS